LRKKPEGGNQYLNTRLPDAFSFRERCSWGNERCGAEGQKSSWQMGQKRGHLTRKRVKRGHRGGKQKEVQNHDKGRFDLSPRMACVNPDSPGGRAHHGWIFGTKQKALIIRPWVQPPLTFPLNVEETFLSRTDVNDALPCRQRPDRLRFRTEAGVYWPCRLYSVVKDGFHNQSRPTRRNFLQGGVVCFSGGLNAGRV